MEDQIGQDQVQQSPSKDERNWAMACHLSALAMFVLPFGGIVGPLVVWLMKREQYPLVNDQGKESLNFQITLVGCAIVLLLLTLPLQLLKAFGLFGVGRLYGLGFFGLMGVLQIVDLIFIIVAAIAVNDGKKYRYPFAVRLIK